MIGGHDEGPHTRIPGKSHSAMATDCPAGRPEEPWGWLVHTSVRCNRRARSARVYVDNRQHVVDAMG